MNGGQKWQAAVLVSVVAQIWRDTARARVFFYIDVRSSGNVVLKGWILMKARKVIFTDGEVHASSSLQIVTFIPVYPHIILKGRLHTAVFLLRVLKSNPLI